MVKRKQSVRSRVHAALTARVNAKSRAVDAPRQRIGVMGGTFDPIHNGHLVAASEVADKFDLDFVLFVPTGDPWQKRGRKVSHSEDRYLMTVIATASNPQFSVSRVDIDRPGPTYTVDTLRDLKVIYPNADLFFITGADALQKIMTWRDWEDMFDAATFVGVTRPGVHLSDKDLEGLDTSRLHLIEIPAMAISSTDCRERAAAGRPVWYLVPDGVVQYIAKRGLYQDSEGTVGSAGPAETASTVLAGGAGSGDAVRGGEGASACQSAETSEAGESDAAGGTSAGGAGAASPRQ